MSVPEHLWRFPTRAAIESLATRFGFPYTSQMQDWEWEVADPKRIDEFLRAYEGGELSDDERFTLMETILQSFEDLSRTLEADKRWLQVLALLEANIQLHIYTVWYWADLENDTTWKVAPFLRQILEKHRGRFENSTETG